MNEAQEDLRDVINDFKRVVERVIMRQDAEKRAAERDDIRNKIAAREGVDPHMVGVWTDGVVIHSVVKGAGGNRHE